MTHLSAGGAHLNVSIDAVASSAQTLAIHQLDAHGRREAASRGGEDSGFMQVLQKEKGEEQENNRCAKKRTRKQIKIQLLIFTILFVISVMHLWRNRWKGSNTLTIQVLDARKRVPAYEFYVRSACVSFQHPIEKKQITLPLDIKRVHKRNP